MHNPCPACSFPANHHPLCPFVSHTSHRSRAVTQLATDTGTLATELRSSPWAYSIVGIRQWSLAEKIKVVTDDTRNFRLTLANLHESKHMSVEQMFAYLGLGWDEPI